MVVWIEGRHNPGGPGLEGTLGSGGKCLQRVFSKWPPQSILPGNKEPFRMQLLEEELTAVGALPGVLVSGSTKEARSRGLSFILGSIAEGGVLRAEGLKLGLGVKAEKVFKDCFAVCV